MRPFYFSSSFRPLHLRTDLLAEARKSQSYRFGGAHFTAAEGECLMDQAGEMYIHTGVITSKSIDATTGKYVPGNWGKDDSTLEMKREGKTCIRFVS
ncbi:MAG: hypothetical protein U0Z17_02945 [Bacteroidales bacterium]